MRTYFLGKLRFILTISIILSLPYISFAGFGEESGETFSPPKQIILPDDILKEICTYLGKEESDIKIAMANTSMFMWITGCTREDLKKPAFLQTENFPFIKGYTFYPEMIDFKKFSEEQILSMPTYIWKSVLRGVRNLPPLYWALLKDTRIHTIDFSMDLFSASSSKNRLGDEGVRNFTQHLKNTAIHTLDLSSNRIEEDGIRALIQNLKGTKVHILTLSYNRIKDESARIFAQNLKGTHLHTVNLSHNLITDVGARDFAQNLNGTHIHTVNFSHNLITDKGARDFAQNLKDTHVHTIDLSFNNIGDKGAYTLAQNLNGTRIHAVNLLHNHIEAETKKCLKETYSHIKWFF